MGTELELEREEFRSRIEAMRAIDEGENVEAKAKNELPFDMVDQVKKWDREGKLKLVLEPLLADETPEVRAQAAGFLLLQAGDIAEPLRVLIEGNCSPGL